MPAQSESRPFMLLFKNAGTAAHAHLMPDERKRLAQQWNDWL